MNSLEIREFEQGIINQTNQSPLPLEVKRLIMENICAQVNEATNKQIQVELTERNSNKESEVESNGNE